AFLPDFNGTNGTRTVEPAGDLQERECHHRRNQRHSNSTRNGTPPEPAVSPLPPHLVAERADRSAQTVRRQPCPRCGADTLTARPPDPPPAPDPRPAPHPLHPAT